MAIRLRPLMEKDASGMLEWMRDPSIARFFRFEAEKMTLDSCRSYIAAAGNDPDCRHYAIADETDTYLGTISLKNIDRAKKEAEYAISTRSCAHGTGAAMSATMDILDIAFGALGLTRVYLNVLADNGRANAFYKKAGFRFTHTEQNALTIRSETKDLNWYSISAEEWSDRKNG